MQFDLLRSGLACAFGALVCLPGSAQFPESTARDELLDPDTDGDGLSDFQERHKYGTDPALVDSDGDGIGDGDGDERREYAYTVRTRVRVVKPVDVLAANDDFQDARLLAAGDDWAELEVIHYPLGTAAEAIGSDPDWRERSDALARYLESTTTSDFDAAMREQLVQELRARGIDAAAEDDRTIAVAAAQQLMERSRSGDGFTTFLADFEDGRPFVPPELVDVARQYEDQLGLPIADQWRRELFARGMFAEREHGTCTSSAIYLCGGLRAVGIPTRIVLLIPLVDANDPEQLAMVASGIRHHRVRNTALRGLRNIAAGWTSHTFNEVFVDGRWRRLNYTRLGQPILDESLFGLTTHVLTVRDWADARMGRTVGRRQELHLRDERFATANPYATLEVSDEFGEHADIANPFVAEPEPLDSVTIERAVWVASDERPEHLQITGVDLREDRQHILLSARTEGVTLERGVLDPFWNAAPRQFQLVPPHGDPVPATAVRGMWWGKVDSTRFLYFMLGMSEQAREQLVPGAVYTIEALPVGSGPHFEVESDVSVIARD